MTIRAPLYTQIFRPDWTRAVNALSQGLNPNLFGGGIEPFYQTDWPNPWGWPFPVENRTWLQSTNLSLIQPFNQTDWPNPRGYPFPTENRTWLQSGNAIIGGGIEPFAQYDWPNPRGPQFPVENRTWAWNGAILLPPPSTTPPPTNYDWPNPIPYPFPVENRGWLYNQTINLPAPAPVVTPAVGRAGKKVKKSWRLLPNGIRVYGTEEGFRTLLDRALLARTEVTEEVAPPEPIAVELREPEKALAQPAVKGAAAPIEARPLLGEPPIPSIAPPQADDSRMASIVAAAVLRQREIAAENERQAAAKAEAERAAAEEAERQRLIEVDNEETISVLRALGIDLHDWPTLTAEAEDEEQIVERLIMELLS